MPDTGLLPENITWLPSEEVNGMRKEALKLVKAGYKPMQCCTFSRDQPDGPSKLSPVIGHVTIAGTFYRKMKFECDACHSRFTVKQILDSGNADSLSTKPTQIRSDSGYSSIKAKIEDSDDGLHSINLGETPTISSTKVISNGSQNDAYTAFSSDTAPVPSFESFIKTVHPNHLQEHTEAVIAANSNSDSDTSSFSDLHQASPAAKGSESVTILPISVMDSTLAASSPKEPTTGTSSSASAPVSTIAALNPHWQDLSQINTKDANHIGTAQSLYNEAFENLRDEVKMANYGIQELQATIERLEKKVFRIIEWETDSENRRLRKENEKLRMERNSILEILKNN